MLHYYFKAIKFLGSRDSKTRAREGGASVFTSFAFLSFLSVPPSEKTLSGFQQAGKKKKGCGENEFLPACFARRRRAVGWEAARPCVSKEAKPAKIDSLIVRQLADCARPLKNVSIFADFASRRQTASRWAGLPPAGRQLVGVFSEMSSDFFQQTPPY